MTQQAYPRPDLQRREWLSLDGKWDFAFDDDRIGLKNKWFRQHEYPLSILVPFAFQTKKSGINEHDFHDYIWYHRVFTLPESWSDKDIIIHFQAVDFACRVYLNGRLVGRHLGGQAPFSFIINPYIQPGKQNLTVYVEDPSTDIYMPRGKQYWKEKPESIWYDRTSGIWQSVWLEPVAKHHLTGLRFTPDYDQGRIKITTQINKAGEKLSLEIWRDKQKIHVEEITPFVLTTMRDIQVFHSKDDEKKYSWTPENPFLFHVVIRYGEDELTSYFGMRKVSTQAGRIYLNNQPYYLRLVLDQGYWPDTLLTPPSKQALKDDILKAKKLGFNGARKHQKAEDPYYAYYADQLGFLVWGEMASSVGFSKKSARLDLNEWRQIIPRDYNHPSIIAWVPLNESWGVPEIKSNRQQQRHALMLYRLIKQLDPTRLVINNDGWEMTKTDICAIHNYRHGAPDDQKMQEKFAFDLSSKEHLVASKPAGRPIFADGFAYSGQPILLTEFGGINFTLNGNGWGYTKASSAEEFIAEYKRIITTIANSPDLAGYCYTQLYDVEQEINGLLDYERNEKVDAQAINEINTSVTVGKSVPNCG